MGEDSARVQLLETAERLFYARGIQSVGMDDVRSDAGLSLKRLYQLYPSKQQLVEAMLERRDLRWRRSLADHVDTHEDAAARILAVFEWMRRWFEEPAFRGCAWINAHGELGAVSPGVARLAREHKRAFREYLDTLVADAALGSELTDQLVLLAEGAMVTAGILGSSEPARHAAAAARTLLEAEVARP